jgi:hypothetical protein
MTIRDWLVFVVGIMFGVAFWVTLESVLGVLAFVLLLFAVPWPKRSDEAQ